MTIETIRRDTADEIYTNYDFSYEVVDADGWEMTVPGDEMSRVVYFVDPEAPEGDSIKGVFKVRFEGEDSIIPVEAIAYVNGECVGNIMGGELADYIVNDLPAPSRPSI